uniref:Alpha-mannosidase n=1 Tax=Caenorhabditis japonica TaxID=281687 RepID=A0A8R1DTP1_CAEJA
MGTRNFYILLSLGIFLTVSLYLYSGIESGTEAIAQRQQFVDDFRVKIQFLEGVVKENGRTIERLEQEVQQAKAEKNMDFDEEKEKLDEKEREIEVAPVRGNRGRMEHVHQVMKHTQPTPSMSNVCGLRANVSVAHSDLQMLDLYDTWKFENPDGGVWKQGWKIEYDAEAVKSQPKLEVIVIPHSHCDPGWILTFEEYYSRQTRKILDGMAKHLGEKDEMRFIYAEISFFEMWWRDQTEETRRKVKGYLENGKLEIVTGGWVMTDEANAHYHSMVTELFEGHEWISNHLGKSAIPKSHWSIDPFGLSPSMPHLLTSANITNAVIQRVHYSVKRELALKKNLEFYWRQLFGQTGHPDFRSHIMPFYSYDVPHTCGPEPAVCCQFDFRRMPEGGKSCDWGIPPQKIDDKNVAERAKMIYDQYRKKSQLFKNNVILQPLGDDFRYDIEFEWNSQYENYQKLFEYMNSKPEWNVHAQFGTLSDYFKKLDTAISDTGNTLPTLSGDFFTYADRDDHYWSGYFTSRPFYKQLDRVLQHYLRSAEIAFSLANIEEEGMVEKNIFEKLVTARRALSLFQHHDGVTGTAKDHVVSDYGQKMIEALNACEEVLSESLVILLGIDSTKKMEMDERRENENVLPEKRVFRVGQNVVLFNTLSRNRVEPLCIYTDSSDAGIEADPAIVQKTQQISPVFAYDEQKNLHVKNGVFELCFPTKLGPFESVSLKIVKSTTTTKAAVKTNSANIQIDSAFKSSTSSGDFTLENDMIRAEFDGENGMIKKMTSLVDGKPIDLNPHFVHYGSRKSKGHFANGNEDNPAGAYLFLPDGEARELKKQSSDWIVVEGNVVKKVFTTPVSELKTLQTYTLYQGLPWLDLDNEVDVRSKDNIELALRFSTSVNSGDEFFTDLNGMQMIKRRRQSKLPTQANFYPMSAGVYIEDESTRMSIHSAQALAVASLSSGQIEIMLDRRLSTDDNRGLAQGVRDNKRTVAHFRIVVEPMSAGGSIKGERVGFHSSVGHLATWSLHYPVVKMIGEATPKSISSKNMEEEMNCDMHVVTFRTLATPTTYDENSRSTFAEKKAALVLHRVVPDCRSRLSLPNSSCLRSGFDVEPIKLIPTLKSAKHTSLTNLYEGQKADKFNLQPNDVSSILVSF